MKPFGPTLLFDGSEADLLFTQGYPVAGISVAGLENGRGIDYPQGWPAFGSREMETSGSENRTREISKRHQLTARVSVPETLLHIVSCLRWASETPTTFYRSPVLLKGGNS